MRNQGHPNHLFDGRPVIGICNTWSELTPCNGHFREIAESVRRGVYEAGGFPLEFPVFSASESNLRPTAMLFRNLASMDVEEAMKKSKYGRKMIHLMIGKKTIKFYTLARIPPARCSSRRRVDSRCDLWGVWGVMAP